MAVGERSRLDGSASRRAHVTNTRSRGADEIGPSGGATPYHVPRSRPLLVGAVDRVGIVTCPGDGIATHTPSGRRLRVVDEHDLSLPDTDQQ